MAKKESPMKLAIIGAATELFFENGFTKTTAAAVCKKANVGTGNLTSYFPTKDHILDVLVSEMCEFQWRMMEESTDEGQSSLLAYCFELTTMAAVAESNAPMRDFFLASYRSPITLDTIRRSDTEKLKKVFGPYCKDWTDQQFAEAENIISGIEYATLMTTDHSPDLPTRIAGSLDVIMTIFGVPEELRKTKVRKALAMDYMAVGKRVLKEFREFTRQEHEKAVEEMLAMYNLKKR